MSLGMQSTFTQYCQYPQLIVCFFVCLLCIQVQTLLLVMLYVFLVSYNLQ